GIKSKYQICNDVGINSKGNVVLCGEISGSQIDFDPGSATYYANSGAGIGHFIAAYTSDGNFLSTTWPMPKNPITSSYKI
ncbi:MAG TPA: hypothetical protein VGI61_05300, partial [Parafilimonas sp.]